MTLDDLLKAFDRTRIALPANMLSRAVYWAQRDGTSCRDPRWWAERKWDYPEPTEVSDAARHYLIAWRFGEFDRRKALMLWKLQKQ